MANFQQLQDDEYTEEEAYGVQNVIDEINSEPPQVEQEELEEEGFGDLSDVEIRLEEANCLKALLNNSLFEEPLNPIAKRVERRIRAFIHTELKVLLGIEVIKAEPKLFTNDELTILKALANKVISKSGPPIHESTKVIEPEIIKVPQAQKNLLVRAPDEPVKVRKARTPKIRPPQVEVQKPKQLEMPIINKPAPTRKITLPNGMEVAGISTATQVKGTGAFGYPTLSAEQQANYYEQQGLTSKPNTGILGLAAAAVDSLNALNTEE